MVRDGRCRPDLHLRELRRRRDRESNISTKSFVAADNTATLHYERQTTNTAPCDGTHTTFVTVHQTADQAIAGEANILVVRFFPTLGNIYDISTSGGDGFIDHAAIAGCGSSSAYDFAPGAGFGSELSSSALTTLPWTTP